MAHFKKDVKESRPLSERIAKARSEGRTQQALELVKELAKNEPTPEHQQLLRTVIFERGSQLLREGKPKDAITVFNNALTLNGPPEFRAAVAAKLAQAGDIATALSLFAQLPDSPERAKAFTQSVDAALVKGAAGRDLLPADLHAGFDAILAAFGHSEQGRDDAAREALQPIGLSSPFLEWKVMLRGLIAYYQKDDMRALDNWQRLDPERLPWRLVAPFRAHIDAGFRDSQPLATRQRLQSLLDRQGQSPFIPALRALQKVFGPWHEEKDVSRAFSLARNILKSAPPDLAAKLARLFYAKTALDGDDEGLDADEFELTFPPPPDDPKLVRLKALASEKGDLPDVPVESWLEYQRQIAESPELSSRFPGDTGKLARALIYERILPIMKDAVKEYNNIPKHIPRPHECLQKSIDLVPTRVRPHQLLVEMLRADKKKKKQAIGAAEELIARFPEDAATLEYLGDVAVAAKKLDAAIDRYRAALRGDPLNPLRRHKLADALWLRAVKLATPPANRKKPVDPQTYRPLFEESARLMDAASTGRLAAWSVIESRLGNADAAAEIKSRIEQRPHQRLAGPLALYVAAMSDKKAPFELQAEYLRKWGAVRAMKATPDEALAGLDALRAFEGYPAKEKKSLINALLPKATAKALEAYDCPRLIRLGHALTELDANDLAEKVGRQAQTRFPKNSWCHLLMAEITLAGRYQSPIYAVDHLERARKFAVDLPREEQDRVLQKIKDLDQQITDKHGAPPTGFMEMLENIFNDMPDFD